MIPIYYAVSMVLASTLSVLGWTGIIKNNKETGLAPIWYTVGLITQLIIALVLGAIMTFNH